MLRKRCIGTQALASVKLQGHWRCSAGAFGLGASSSCPAAEFFHLHHPASKGIET